MNDTHGSDKLTAGLVFASAHDYTLDLESMHAFTMLHKYMSITKTNI